MIRRTPSLVAALAFAAALSVQPALAQRPSPLPAEALADVADAGKAAWLRKNVVAEGPATGGLKFDLPREFFASKLVLLGESHGSAAPHVVDLELLTLLNARAGVRDYLIEADPLQAASLNRYLANGDEKALDAVFHHWRDVFSQWGSKAYRDKVIGVRKLNMKLPASGRVRFHGLDAIQDWGRLAAWLSSAGAPIDATALTAAKSGGDKAKLALAALAAAKPSGALANELRATLQMQANGIKREPTIFGTYERLVQGGVLGTRPAYGMWGIFHVLQQPMKDRTPPFAALVRASKLPASKNLQSIVLLSLDSAVQVPAPLPGGTKRLRMTEFNIDGPLVKVSGSATLRAASEAGQVRVFRLGAPGSPFTGSSDFMDVRTSINQDLSPADPGARSTDIAQYVGVYRGSDWAKPLETVR